MTGSRSRSLATFERLFGLALLVEIATQVTSGVWSVHAGALYPWRDLGIVPLYPPAVLLVEWLVTGACGLALALPLETRAGARARAIAWRVLPLVLLVAVLERFSNHGVLFFLVAFFASMATPEDDAQPNVALLRSQLVIVYVFSALAKLAHGFMTGASLANLLGVSTPVAQALSFVVVATELALPVLYWRRPRLAFVGASLMHAAFAAKVSGVVSFGLGMLALGALFLTRPERGALFPSPYGRADSGAPPPPR